MEETDLFVEVFDLCVVFLEVLGPKLGMTYKEINIWLFVIIQPLVTVGSIWYAMSKRWELRHLNRSVRTLERLLMKRQR